VEYDLLFQSFAEFLNSRREAIMECWLLHVHERPELSTARHLPRA